MHRPRAGVFVGSKYLCRDGGVGAREPEWTWHVRSSDRLAAGPGVLERVGLALCAAERTSQCALSGQEVVRIML